jgi:hypothetical protein
VSSLVSNLGPLFVIHNALLLAVQAWCKENGTSDKLLSLLDAPKAGRFLDAWCSGRWVSHRATAHVMLSPGGQPAAQVQCTQAADNSIHSHSDKVEQLYKCVDAPLKAAARTSRLSQALTKAPNFPFNCLWCSLQARSGQSWGPRAA